MKRYIVFIVLYLLIILQSNWSLANNNIVYPPIYHTLNLISKKFSKEDYIDSIFSPIGWSTDGKLAYIVEVINEAGDIGECAIFKWVIFDLVTDKVLWDSGTNFEKELPRNLWYASSEEIFKWEFVNLFNKYKKYFDKFQIKINLTTKILRFPYFYNNNTYNGFITDIHRETKYDIPDMITSYKTVVTKNNIAKIVGRYDDKFLLDIQIPGFIISPYEPRIALVVCSISRGWEGPPHPIECSFVGCHLEKGY
ncbi:MAG: hypothetical protein K6U80_18275 [Firmicutes bacterium]|nr:hypothetical protein [Bacillota bacterium]